MDYYRNKLCSTGCRFILFCYQMDFMLSISDDKQAGIIDAFNNTSRYLDNIPKYK